MSGSNLFVAKTNTGTIGEYTTSGATVNASLITGLGIPQGIAVSGSNLFVADENDGTIHEYTTSGATVNAALVSGLTTPLGIAVFGTHLYVVSGNIASHSAGIVGEYDATTGAAINASLITGLNEPFGIVVVPEPSTWALLAIGVGALLVFRLRHRRAANEV